MNFENIHWQNTSHFKKISSIVLLSSLICALSACCVRNKVDPLEKFNRKIFMINSTVDSLYIKPAALFYDKFLPKPFRYATNNFFSNLREVPTIVNDLLQLKFKQARCALARLCINTTWGVAGFIDVATWLGKIEKHVNDFGLTMAHYGYRESIYLVIPLIGPSTFRDGIGIYVDTYTGVWPYIRPAALGWTLYAISLVDARAKLLYAEPIIEEASVDRYIFIRNAYLQHRRYLMDIDKDPEVCDLSEAKDLPDDNEASTAVGEGSTSNKPLASDMPDDNEDLKPGDKNVKDHQGNGPDNKEEEKPKVGAAAVAALEVDDIYNPTAQGTQSLALYEAILVVTRKQTFNTMLYIAPGTIFKITIILPTLKQDSGSRGGKQDKIETSQEISSSSSLPNNPEEIKGTSTITDAVGGRSR